MTEKCTNHNLANHLEYQHYYKCLTCARANQNQSTPRSGFVTGTGIGVDVCEKCAKICHKGHELVDQNGKTYCDCCSSKGLPSCKCCDFPLLCTVELKKKCPNMNRSFGLGSYTSSSPPDQINQHTWQCKTCGIVGDQYICNACKERCHAGHEVIDTGKRHCACSCASKCQCKALTPLTEKEVKTYIETNKLPVDKDSSSSSSYSSDEEKSHKKKRSRHGKHHRHRSSRRHHQRPSNIVILPIIIPYPQPLLPPPQQIPPIPYSQFPMPFPQFQLTTSTSSSSDSSSDRNNF